MNIKEDNTGLANANASKDDEFYTTYDGAKKLLSQFIGQLRGKSLFLNCDDPKKSKIYKYLVDNFKKFDLRKVTAIGYGGNFASTDDGDQILVKKLSGDGSFESSESKSQIAKHDAIVSNPPFSQDLFHKFLELCIDSGKDFLIIGPITSVATKKTIGLLAANPQVHVGRSAFTKFDRPDNSMKNVGNFVFTTFDGVRKSPLPETEEYLEDKYKYIDKYDCIFIKNISDIPYNYSGRLAVPQSIFNFAFENKYELTGELTSGIIIDGKKQFTRIIIKTK